MQDAFTKKELAELYLEEKTEKLKLEQLIQELGVIIE
jgi:hypothetical protein